MELKRIFNYEKINIPFSIRDDMKIYKIIKGKKDYGILILRKFIKAHIVSFNIREPMDEEEYKELFFKIVKLIKDFRVPYILHYAIAPNPFSNFLMDIGGNSFKRVEMILNIDEFSPLHIFPPPGIDIRPFIMKPLTENIETCFNSIPYYDREIFSTKIPADLIPFYTYLYTGREGIFMPEFSMSIYSGDKLLGFILVNIFKNDILTISEIVIFSKYQGRGLGKFLLNESIKKIKNSKYKNLSLSVTLENKNAYNMYKKFGFQEERYYIVYVYHCME